MLSKLGLLIGGGFLVLLSIAFFAAAAMSGWLVMFLLHTLSGAAKPPGF